MPGLFVFDLDGTLVDSHRDIASAANALVEERGGAPLSEAAVVGMVGEGAALLVRRALAAAGLDPDGPGALDRFLEIYAGRLLDHTVLYPGTAVMLEQVAALAPLAVLTNKPQRHTDAILEGLGLRHHFGDVIGGDTALGRKPDPAGLLHLVAAAGVTPDETCMIGDSPIDLLAARAAGTRICLVRYGFGFRFGPQDLRGDEIVVDSAAEIPAALARR